MRRPKNRSRELGLSMYVRDFLSPVNVSIDFKTKDKSTLLHDLAELIATTTNISTTDIEHAVIARERLGGTGTGNGIALPHARFPGIQRPTGHFVRLEKPVDYGSVDDRPVDLAFMLLLPAGADGKPLSALACVARKLREMETLTLLRRAKDRMNFYTALVE
jgi:nitrogen PTS system EIIA component